MINKNCHLVLNDLYFYDFKSAYPRILESVGWDFSNIDLDNKEERNIHIGMSQRGNENLSSFLISYVDSLLEFYLRENGIEDDDIIVSQRDGFILKKHLDITDTVLKLDFRYHIDTLVITPDRKKYLTINDKTVNVKGISHFYDELLLVYSMFSNLNLINKKNLFKQLDSIKKKIFEQDKSFYLIKIDDKVLVQFKNIGCIEVTNPNIISLSNIDKLKYYDHYFKEFIQSFILEFY